MKIYNPIQLAELRALTLEDLDQLGMAAADASRILLSGMASMGSLVDNMDLEDADANKNALNIARMSGPLSIIVAALHENYANAEYEIRRRNGEQEDDVNAEAREMVLGCIGDVVDTAGALKVVHDVLLDNEAVLNEASTVSLSISRLDGTLKKLNDISVKL